jgi:hypothetical protein
MKTHNKKRNSLLIYEFLVKTISRALLENDNRKQNIAFKLLKKHYKTGTELYKEFRIANALYRTTVSSNTVAGSILNEAKSALRKLDDKKLNKEKSILIKEINYKLGQNTYNELVNDYKLIATIQTLFNEWKSDNCNLNLLAEYEDKITGWLTLNEKCNNELPIPDQDPGTTRLVIGIMNEKLNNKYSEKLNECQKNILRLYTLNGYDDNLKNTLSSLKEELLSKLQLNEDKKLSEIHNMLTNESLEIINDDTITRFMMYAKLEQEINEVGHE